MLILERKLGQSVIIGDDIEVVVVKIDRNRIKLGIAAPAAVSVHRKEVYVQIHGEPNVAADLGGES